MNEPGKCRPGLVTVVLACITLVVLLVSAPASLREAFDRGGFYVFSQSLFEDIPGRLSGPGRFRFVVQPLVAIILGIRSGLAEARKGQPPYLWAMLFRPELRAELFRSGFLTIVNLLLMSVLLDSLLQWVILGTSYPGAALLVGPILIVAPYSVARALTNRFASLRRRS